MVRMTELVSESPEVPVSEADERSVRPLPDGLVPIRGVTESNGTVYGYRGAEVLPSSIVEEFTRAIVNSVPGVCDARVAAEPVAEGVLTVAIEMRVCPMVLTITVVDRAL